MKILPTIKNRKRERLLGTLISGDLVHETSKGFGDYAQRIVYSNEDLAASLLNSLKMHDHEVAQNQTIMGKVVALFSKPKNADWMEVDGTRLIQLLEMSGTECSEVLLASEVYSVEVAGLRQLVQRAAREALDP